MAVDVTADVTAPEPRRESMILKILILGFLMLVLLIPLSMIGNIVEERQQRALHVYAEVAAGWGSAQTVGPLLLTVPYRETYTEPTGRVVNAIRMARFLPEDLQVDTRVVPEVRRRSLYDVVIYTAHVKMTGYFKRPSPALLRLNPLGTTMLWDDAKLTLPVSERKGIVPGATLKWRDAAVELSPSAPAPFALVLSTGLEAPASGLAEAEADPEMKLPFEIVMDLKGSGSIELQPSGKTTVVHLSAPWRDPSFTGAFLPDSRQIGDEGFEATWRLTSLSRPYPQAWRDQDLSDNDLSANLGKAEFGATFIQTVDAYQQTDRSIKYGALFILLTFTTFVLVELLQSVRVHPVQYLMVGAALCLFYLLLLSLSEHLRFGLAYAIGAAATIGVITMYTVNVLGGLRQGLMTGTGLSGLYVFLYVLLQLEDYALLTGSVALFLILAFLMFITRRINWYELRRTPA